MKDERRGRRQNVSPPETGVSECRCRRLRIVDSSRELQLVSQNPRLATRVPRPATRIPKNAAAPFGCGRTALECHKVPPRLATRLSSGGTLWRLMTEQE